ncbi:MAG: sensor histidine kinase [Bacteroidales bacterium]
MKFSTLSDPTRLATINASIISACYLIISLPAIYLTDLPWWYLIISLLFVFAVSFFILRISIQRFLSNKIHILYKTIRRQKSAALPKSLKNDPIHMEKVEEEVQKWSAWQQQEIDELKRMALYRREFLGNISHELKTPIFNIQGYILTLLEGGIDDPSINKIYLERTEKSINRMITLVEDLEIISKLESGELKLHVSDFDLVKISNEVIEMLQSKALLNDTRIILNGTSARPVLVHADKEKIVQVLTNLVDNSLKYGKKDGETRISFFDLEETYLVEVSDNGIGIEESNLPRLFERFFRTDKARSRDEGGSGLGLAIVKHIIEAHGQNVNVRSTVGVGTTFGFTLEKAKS